MDKKNDHKQDEYDFYREVMKKKPLDKRKIAVSAAGVAAGAVLFGVIAAFVFAKSVPYFRPEEEQPRVNIVEGASTDGAKKILLSRRYRKKKAEMRRPMKMIQQTRRHKKSR